MDERKGTKSGELSGYGAIRKRWRQVYPIVQWMALLRDSRGNTQALAQLDGTVS